MPPGARWAVRIARAAAALSGIHIYPGYQYPCEPQLPLRPLAPGPWPLAPGPVRPRSAARSGRSVSRACNRKVEEPAQSVPKGFVAQTSMPTRNLAPVPHKQTNPPDLNAEILSHPQIM